MYSERERANVLISEEEKRRIMLKKAMRTGEVAKAAQINDLESAMDVLEGIIATCMICQHPGQELGAFAGGAVWMAQVIHSVLTQFDGHIEFGIEKKTMSPLLGPAQLAMLQSSFEAWKRDATINYETNDGHRMGVDKACDLARQVHGDFLTHLKGDKDDCDDE